MAKRLDSGGPWPTRVRPDSTMARNISFSVIVPTYHAGSQWRRWLEAFARQTIKPRTALVLDSSSQDGTPELARQYGFAVRSISPHDFNHGRTRQLGIELTGETGVACFLTQDAVLASDTYGGQLPRAGAGPIGAHARLFNFRGIINWRPAPTLY